MTDKLKKCEEKIDKVSKQCVMYKELLKSVVEKRAINEIEKLKSAQEDTVKKLKHRQYYLKKKHDDLIKNMSGGVLTFFVNKVLKGMHFEKRAALVLEMVLSGKMFGEVEKDVTKDFVKNKVRKVFTAWRLCKAKDTAHQGCLNLHGIEAVSRTQDLEKGEQGFITSKSAMWLEGDELLHEVAYPMFMPTHMDDEKGEIFS